MEESKESTDFKKHFPKMKDDRYEYLGHLGKGRAGQVFKARDILLKKDIVIKAMCSEVPRQEDFQRFQREARAFSSLQHPNILRVLDFGLAEDQTPYLVTDFVDGTTIEEYLDSGKRKFSVKETIDIAIQLSQAMAHSHNRGVLHRDLKPSNILLTNVRTNPHVFILDFGLAKFTDAHQGNKNDTLTRPGQILGTPEYMSPEQAKGQRCDELSDIYSLGCILFEMVAGRPPFEDKALMEVIRMQCDDPPPLNLLDKAPDGDCLKDVLEKALAKAPADRFSSMAEMESTLKEIKDSKFSAKKESKKSTAPPSKEAQQEDSMAEEAAMVMQESEEADEPPAIHTHQSPVAAPQFSPKRLKVLPVVILCVLLALTFLILITSMFNRSPNDYSFEIESSPVKKKLANLEKNGEQINLVEDAMILTGKLEGNQLTLAGTIGTDNLLLDAARTGKKISTIDASRAKVTDFGMPTISRISPSTLILSGTDITDKSLLMLKGNPNLRNLIVDETENIRGDSFKILPTIPNLHILSVGGSKLTDSVFSSLANCNSLGVLCINSSPRITNDVFSRLSTIPNIATLYIGNCPQITEDGLNEFKKNKPYALVKLQNKFFPVEQITELGTVLNSERSQGFLD